LFEYYIRILVKALSICLHPAGIAHTAFYAITMLYLLITLCVFMPAEAA
jgi:hypothetical protein